MNERHAKILELLSRYHKMEVSRLSTLLNVSQVTIRKDLIALEQSGMLVREHGYATLNNSDDINKRLAFHFEQKMQIVKRAAQLVEDGETIFIESGSCCALLAVEIAQTKKDVTIVTNSAFIADYVRKIENVQIVLLGGNYQKESQVMVGPMTAQCAQAYFADKLFIGTDGFSIRTGFTGNDYMRSVAVQDMAKSHSGDRFLQVLSERQCIFDRHQSNSYVDHQFRYSGGAGTIFIGTKSRNYKGLENAV